MIDLYPDGPEIELTETTGSKHSFRYVFRRNNKSKTAYPEPQRDLTRQEIEIQKAYLAGVEWAWKELTRRITWHLENAHKDIDLEELNPTLV